MTTGPTTEPRAEDAGLGLGTAPGRLALTATVAASGMARSPSPRSSCSEMR
jgi:hypothetical protein